MVKDNISTWKFSVTIEFKLFLVKKPPDEITVNDKLKDSKILKSAITYKKISKVVVIK